MGPLLGSWKEEVMFFPYQQRLEDLLSLLIINGKSIIPINSTLPRNIGNALADHRLQLKAGPVLAVFSIRLRIILLP